MGRFIDALRKTGKLKRDGCGPSGGAMNVTA
ncbi:MAG: hypothetical protein K0R28_630 [Paenibacillus sp.]|nr:hypothetical protein [Paenibacillus sp.]